MSSRSASPTSPSATSSRGCASGANARRIDRLRREIDRLDLSLLRMVERRVKLAAGVLALKRGAGLPARDPAREREILDRLSAGGTGTIPPAEIRALFARMLLAVRRAAGIGPSRRARPARP